MTINKILWPFFILLSVLIGLYPIIYLVVDMTAENGFLSSKGAEILGSQIWNIAFYVHILAGGLSLLTGWSQFSKKIRSKYLNFHRNLGKVYLISVLLSGLTGFYIAIYANGGMIAKLGFATLAILWLFTAWQAYTSIKKKDVLQHQNWMIRNYALSWAGVMLRLWIPFFLIVFGLEFILAYKIIAWFSWVPNLFVAQWIISRNGKD